MPILSRRKLLLTASLAPLALTPPAMAQWVVIDPANLIQSILQLVESGNPFDSLDYVAPTPEWAIVGHPQRGFDPVEVRHRRGKPVEAPAAQQ